ncbi:hypothetical protein [Moorena sp. SIO4A5]|uniref:hypothetical protein n=1 Tax=Moorena sp. SIO4A5 TaxID=2607838 RepID=UPI0013C98359|nr:hypothetical protein [Moorena sp. SIO4A5]NEO24119.1 hypothetical protein [Moorena sp. SIO4A5]
MQRGLGEAVRSWGGSAVLGVSPMSDCRGSPHEQLPWFPRGLQGADAGSAHRPKTMSDCIKTTTWGNSKRKSPGNRRENAACRFG